MPLRRLQLKNFRLFQDNLFTFSDRTNLILGENGSGKTSILERVLKECDEAGIKEVFLVISKRKSIIKKYFYIILLCGTTFTI